MFRNIINYKFSFFILLFTLLVLACGKDDDNDVVSTAPVVNSFGPSPALRGGDLRFIGQNLDKVTAITLPNNIEITNFKSKSSEMVVITVPEETVDGEVTVKTTDGSQKMKSRLTISEPIAIVSFSPSSVRPGEKVTITGTYLNLIKSVIFPSKKNVETFVAHTKDKIEVIVPEDAQSGKIIISNGEADPILVESETDLNVVLPIAATLSPNPVKAGANLTIGGTDLDLVKKVTFGGGRVATIVSQQADKIVVTVPEDAQDGNVTVEVASLLSVASANALTLVAPVVSGSAPNPVKNGKDLTITGTDLDLVTTVVFGSNKTGTIVSKSEDEIVVTVPLDATDGAATLNTKSTKISQTATLNMVRPTITGISPSTTQANKPITITGTDLDLIVEILFGGGKKLTVNNTNETTLVVDVPSGTTNGALTVTTTNGSQVTTTDELTILASNVPNVTGFPAQAKPGAMITLTGTKMNLFTDVIFPDNIKATSFGIKTEDKIEVIVPLDVKKGWGRIRFVTSDNEVSESDLINFVGVDPVKDPSLVFFDFDSKGAWWGKMQSNVRNDGESVDGTNYGWVNEDLNGWTDLFWRNASNEFPGAVIGTNVNDYVIKLDINIKEAFTGGNIKLRLNGTEGDFWYAIGPATTPSGSTKNSTDGWETITVNISDFKDNYGWGSNAPTSMAAVTNEFGMAWDNGASKVNILIDNVRFERK